jgi:hypothetical protein
MAEIYRVVNDVSGTVDSLSRRKTSLDNTIRTNLVELKTLLRNLADQTLRYKRMSRASKWMNATKNEENFKKLLGQVDSVANRLILSLSANTNEIASSNAAALAGNSAKLKENASKLEETSAAVESLKIGQDKMAAKTGFVEHEKHVAVTVLREAEIPQADIKYLESTHFAEGGFGKVWRGNYAGSKVAIKKFDLQNLPEGDRSVIRKDFTTELGIMYKLRHPCIVAVLGACTSVGDELSLVMELVEKGDLRGLLDKRGEDMDMEVRCSILNDVALGMAYLYGLKPTPVMHRDLKSLNVLVTASWRGKVRNGLRGGFSARGRDAQTINRL